MHAQAESADFNAKMLRKVTLALVGLILFGFIMSRSMIAGLLMSNNLQPPGDFLEAATFFIWSLSLVMSVGAASWLGRRWKPDGSFELRLKPITPAPATPRRYSLQYLLLVIFWWALALGLTREHLVASPYSEYNLACFLLSAIAWGGAYGGLCLRMRFGLIAGAIIMLVLGCYLASTMGRYF